MQHDPADIQTLLSHGVARHHRSESLWGPYILASLTLVMHWANVLVDRKIGER
jgi:hypothetical protein